MTVAVGFYHAKNFDPGADLVADLPQVPAQRLVVDRNKASAVREKIQA